MSSRTRYKNALKQAEEEEKSLNPENAVQIAKKKFVPSLTKFRSQPEIINGDPNFQENNFIELPNSVDYEIPKILEQTDSIVILESLNITHEQEASSTIDLKSNLSQVNEDSIKAPIFNETEIIPLTKVVRKKKQFIQDTIEIGKEEIKENKYPIINHSPYRDPYTLITNSSIDKYSKNHNTAVLTTVALTGSSGILLYNNLLSKLGKSINNAPLAKYIVNQNIFKLFSMNQGALETIIGVGEKTSPKIMNFYSPFIYKVSVAEKVIDASAYVGKTLHEPTQENIIKLAVNLIDLIGTYYQSPYTALLTIGNAAHYAYNGEYIQATMQATMASCHLLPLIMATPNPASLIILSGMAISSFSNFYTFVDHYSNKLNSKDLKAIEETQINEFTNNMGEFGQKLKTHIYLPLLDEKYDLISRVEQGKITQQEADNLRTKHFVIELENRLYDHCIEVKSSFFDENKDYYHCYISDKEIIDRVIIGENNTIERVELENNI